MVSEVSASSTTAAATDRRFGFEFGDGRRFVAAQGILTEIPIGASLQSIPNAPPVLAGAINVRGAIRLVFDPLRFAAFTPLPARRRILLIDRDEFCAGLLIVGEPQLLELKAVSGPIVAGAFSPFVRGLLSDRAGVVHELDHRAWFRHQRDHSTAA